jgi:hypothetical protein
VRSQTKWLSIGVMQSSPTVLHKCISKRFIEFNFSPEKPHEEGNLTRNVFLCILSS